MLTPLAFQPVVQQLAFGRRRHRRQDERVVGGGEGGEVVGGGCHGRPFTPVLRVALAAAFVALAAFWAFAPALSALLAAFEVDLAAAFCAGALCAAAFLAGAFFAAAFLAGAFARAYGPTLGSSSCGQFFRVSR